jgi:beta-glucanase (GH16 family)
MKIRTFGPRTNSQVSATGSVTTQAGMTTGFHVYGCLINADLIHFYIDGVEVANTPTLPEEALPLYVMVDLALGDSFPIDIPSPTRMCVDYIRAFDVFPKFRCSL